MKGDKDWNYNVAMEDPFGRIRISRHQVDPITKLTCDADGLVDVSPLVGSELPIAKWAIAQILGTETCIVDRLIGAGVIRRFRGSVRACVRKRRKFYLFDPGSTLRSLYKAWERELREPTSSAQFRSAKRMYTGCRVPPHVMPPKAVIAGLARKLGPGATFGIGDINAYVVIPRDMDIRVLNAVRSAVGTAQPAREVPHSTRRPTEPEMARRVSFLRRAPGTCFDPHLGEEFAPPDATSRSRLAALGALFGPAAIFAYTQAPLLRHPELLPRYLRNLARFEAEALARDPGFAFNDARSLAAALDHVAFGEKLLRQYSPGVRFETVRDAITVMTRARQKGLQFAADGLSEIDEMLPAEIPDRRLLIERLHEVYGPAIKEQRAQRKRVSHRIADRYARVVDAAAFRVRQIIADGDAMRAAMDMLYKEENGHLAYWDFEAESLNLGERGLPCGGTQLRRFRLWRVEAAVRSVEIGRAAEDEHPSADWMRDNPAPGKTSEFASFKVERRFHGSEFIVEHLETGPTWGAANPLDPWYVTLAKHHSLDPSTWLDQDQLERRETLFRRWRLPAHCSATAGLLSFDEQRARLARIASRSDRRAPRTFVPLEEFEHAIRMAAHGVDAVIQTWCRLGEWMQQTVYWDDWQPEKGSEKLGWRAIAKLAPGEPIPDPMPIFHVDDDHYDEAMNIADLTRRRCHGGGDLPDVRPPRKIAWKCEPQPYVFSFAGRFVDPRNLQHFLHFLFANVGQFTWHPLRHAVSNRARDRGAPIELVRAGLRQRSRDLVYYYSSFSEKQIKRREREVRTRKRARIARQSAGKAAA